jgi:hypothetical protein
MSAVAGEENPRKGQLGAVGACIPGTETVQMPMQGESAAPAGLEKSVLLVGSSHADMLARSHDALGPQRPFRLKTIRLNDSRYEPGWGIWEDGEFNVNRLLMSDIARALRSKKHSHTAVMIGGSSHFELGAVNSPRKFDFTIPGREDLPFIRDAESVPYDLVRQLFAREEKNILKPLVRARELTAFVSCLCAPPPVADGAKVFENIPDELRDQAKSLGVPPAAFRYKVWLIYTSVVREICHAIQVELIDPPPETIDGDGFLKEEYSLDTLHGNHAYGALVLSQIGTRMAAEEAGAA